MASVCTGALLLGKAGYLVGKRATTHRNAYELLAPYCREVVRDQRIVDEGNVITAGGVASALGLGVYLVGGVWGGVWGGGGGGTQEPGRWRPAPPPPPAPAGGPRARLAPKRAAAPAGRPGP